MARRLYREKTYNYWPSFVDVLSTLLVVVLFILLVFILAHFFLGRHLSSQNSEIAVLQQRMDMLSKELSLERKNSVSLKETLDKTLTEKQMLDNRLKQNEETLKNSQNEAIYLTAQAQTLTKEVERLSDLLAQSEALAETQKAQIIDLGKQLNRALAQKVSELAYYRSDFFGRLRKILEDNDNVSIEGDRFVFQSELFFKSGSAFLEPKGKKRLDALARVLLDISKQIPENINWIIRIDGHTDNVPVRNELYASNWELSTARALSVVHYLKQKGVPQKRMAAAGFGQFHPLDRRNTKAARRKNRRIEFKLTEK